jgi:hypothetical protein
MTDELPGSAGGYDSDDPVYIPPAKGDGEGDAAGVDKGVEHMNEEDEIGLREAEVVVLPPKSLSEEEKEAWEETVRVLNARPRLRTIPVELRKKWTQKQIRVWEEAKNAMKRERKRQYSASERKRKATVAKTIEPGHEEEPEFLAVVGKKPREPPPSQPAFTANERARLIHCFASEQFRPFVEVLLKGTQLRVEKDDKLGRPQPFVELTYIFNNMFIEFENFFIDHPHGDDDLLSLDPNEFTRRTDAFLKGDPFRFSFSY